MRLLKKIINLRIEPENSTLVSGIFTLVISALAFAATFSHSSASIKSIIGPVTVPRVVSLLIFVLGMADIARELREAGAVLCAGMLILGNVTFFLLDRLLGMARKKFK